MECAVPGCERDARSMTDVGRACMKHYMRYRRAGGSTWMCVACGRPPAKGADYCTTCKPLRNKCRRCPAQVREPQGEDVAGWDRDTFCRGLCYRKEQDELMERAREELQEKYPLMFVTHTHQRRWVKEYRERRWARELRLGSRDEERALEKYFY